MNSAATLRTARIHAGLTQAELADRAGTSQATLSQYENGRKQPSTATLERLLAAAGARLVVEYDRRPVTIPSRRELERLDRTFQDVLELAAALPTRHAPELTYPRLV